MVAEAKSPVCSKTLIMSILLIAANQFPVVRELYAANPELAVNIVCALFAVIRTVTEKPIKWKLPKLFGG